MNCPNCGNDLPENASFCPYCMIKFYGEDPQNQSKQNRKKQSKTPAIIGITVALIALITTIVLIIALGGDNDTDKVPTKNNQTTTDKNDINPVDYCGTWYNEDFKGESPELEGGNVLKIISMTKDKVIFDLSSYQSPPNSRVAQITGVEADIKNGQAEFLFGNDSWGNGGIGTILFLDEEIYVNIKLTSVSTDSLWSIGTDIKFKKVNDSYKNDTIDFMGVIGDDVDIVKTMLNGIPYEFQSGEWDGTYQCGGIFVGVTEDMVTSVTVDYSQFPEGYRDLLCFSFGINGNAAYEYMENKLGEPISTYEENGDYVSTFNTPEETESYLKVTYSKGEVVSIRYFIMTD